VTSILRKIPKGWRETNPYRLLYLENFLKGEKDRFMEGGYITPGKLNPSFKEWLHWSVEVM
jgi:hypothetical protein